MPEVQPSPGQGAPRVLVVEDDILVRVAIAEELRLLGVTVVEAETADEALSCLLVDGSFDLVFSDVQMSGSLDGAALARQLRESHPRLPVILTSGTATPQDGDGFPFIPKPFDCTAVARTIVAAATEASSRRAEDMDTQESAHFVASEIGRSQVDIDRCAELLIARYGTDAEGEARLRVQILAREGDIAAVASWWRILAAVQELQRRRTTQPN